MPSGTLMGGFFPALMARWYLMMCWGEREKERGGGGGGGKMNIHVDLPS